ncbi:MAG: citrate synthase [Myxococcota bacterium]
MAETAKLQIGEQTVELPVVRGTEGETAVDIRNLRRDVGVVTLDPGFANTGAAESAITFIDGERGVLRYRGYPIEELAQRSHFLEVAHLLIHGELPTEEELTYLTESIRYHTMIHEDLRRFYEAFPKNAHPMSVCAAAVAALSSFYPDSIDPREPEQVHRSIHRLIAKLPTLVSYALKHARGQPFMYPDNRLDYVGNFLHLLFATPCESYAMDPVVRNTLDLLLLLHADHEQNCSSSTMRMVGSSHANLFASVSAAISALWGPRHGGANQRVIEMLIQIREGDLTTKQYVERAKDKDDPTVLFGFGHRVYKSYDPRAKLVKDQCHDALERLGARGELFEIARELEEIALEDDYFRERGLYPNVDFYSGLLYRALGIPENMFPAMFAIGRLPGWIAQWLEMHEQDQRISRPRQVYVGEAKRSYVPLDQRG